MKLADSQTFLNLATAFASESQARNRYEFAEYCARNNGYEAIAQVIDEIAYQEFNHARLFYTEIHQETTKPIEKIAINFDFPFRENWTMEQNLTLMAQDEHDEAYTIYPNFAKTAEKEGFTTIANLFTMVAEAEKQHEKIFKEIYQQLTEGTLYKKNKPVKWKCPACGYTTRAEQVWQKCPLCQTAQGAVEMHVNALNG